LRIAAKDVTMKMKFAVVGVVLIPTIAHSDGTATRSCVDALEQLSALSTQAPVYKLMGGERRFIDDADRPAEIGRLKKVIGASCSADPQGRLSEETDAKRLHIARSPECAIERDKLSAMEQPASHEPPDSLARQRKLVAGKCPLVDTTNVWLVQWLGRSTLTTE
jgi:hypothetical protein